MSSAPPPPPSETDGLPRRLKLALVELVGLVLLVAGAVLLILAQWERGAPLFVLGGFVLLNPTRIVDLIERVFPPSG